MSHFFNDQGRRGHEQQQPGYDARRPQQLGPMPQVQVVQPQGLSSMMGASPLSLNAQVLTHAQLSPPHPVGAAPVSVPVPTPGLNTSSRSNTGMAPSFVGDPRKLFSSSSDQAHCNIGFAVTAALAQQHEKHRHENHSQSTSSHFSTKEETGPRRTPDSTPSPQNAAIILQCLVTKIRSWRTGYTRLLVLTSHHLLTLDPYVEHLPQTNTWSLNHLRVVPDADDATAFHFHLTDTKERLKFSLHPDVPRAILLQAVLKQQEMLLLQGGPPGSAPISIGGALFPAQRWTRQGTTYPVFLQCKPYGLLELSSVDMGADSQATPIQLQTYPWISISGVSLVAGHEHALHFHFWHKIRLWEMTPTPTASSPRSNLVALLHENMANVGLTLPMQASMSTNDWLQQRRTLGASKVVGTIVTQWNVTKSSTRREWKKQQQQCELCITSRGFVLERKAAWVVSCRPLRDLVALVRPSTAPDELVLEWAGGTTRLYQTSTQRDALIVSLLDAASSFQHSIHLVDHGLRGYTLTFATANDCKDVPSAALTGISSKTEDHPPSAPLLATSPFSVTSYCLRRIYALSTQAYAYVSSLGQDLAVMAGSDNATSPNPRHSIVGETGPLQRACREFNVSLSLKSLSADDSAVTKKYISGTIGALSGLVVQLLSSSQAKTTQALAVACTFWQTLWRLVQTPIGFKTTCELDTFQDCIPLFFAATNNEFCQYWALAVLNALVSSPPWLPQRDMESQFVNKSVIFNTGGVALMHGLVSSLLPQNEATSVVSDLILMVTSDILQSVLCTNHDTTSAPHFSAVMGALAGRYRSLLATLKSSTPFVIENVALLLHLLSTHSPKAAIAIREAALSSGLLLKHFHAAIFSPSEGQRFLSRFLCSLWLSGPDECPEKRLLKRMVPRGFMTYLKMPGLSKMEQDQLDEMERADFAAEETNNINSYPHQMANGATGTNAARLRQRIRLAATSTQQQQQPKPRLENFRIFFHVLTQDHMLPDLIWSQQTRKELRAALEHEIQFLEREQEVRQSPLAWNHQQFQVDYTSLVNEVKVGEIYMRLWLQAGDGFIRSWEDPVRLFELLFRRFLCEIDRNNKVAVMCIRCLKRLYAIHSSTIGPFEDMMILVHSMATTKSVEVQHRLLELLGTLLGVPKSDDDDATAVADVPENSEQLLNAQGIGQLCQFVAWGHSDVAQIENIMSRSLADSGAKLMNVQVQVGERDGGDSAGKGQQKEEGGTTDSVITIDNNPSNRDIVCPPIWFTASTGRVPPPAEFVRGPYRTSDLSKLMDEGELSPYDLVASSSAEDYDDSTNSTVHVGHIDTGKWKRLKDVWQLRWQLCNDDSGHVIYSPADVALLATTCLTRLLDLHKSLDETGVPFVPIPSAKRILTSDIKNVEVSNYAGARPFSILAQALLSNDARLVEQSARLLTKLLGYNPEATAKFYLTGAFFFILAYPGSNIASLAELLHKTHLHQNFRSGLEATTRYNDLPMRDRSVLGKMLPEGLLYVLDNYGCERFVDVFLGNADTPEVIWTVEMRKHLIEMIRQHLGDFPLRLHQANTLEYEFCPIPSVSYERLRPELFCHNYYLRNLCDEERFPDWPIPEPIEVLRSCLDKFQEKTDNESCEFLERARVLLALQYGDGSKELRRAYRAKARLFHPDKNPAGRDMFESILKAYEVLVPLVENGGKILFFSEGKEPYDKPRAAEGFAGGMGRMKIMHLLIRAQLLIYRRFSKDVEQLKYPSYHVLLGCIKLPASCETMANDTDSRVLLYSCFVSEPRAEIVRHGVELIFRTCMASPQNAVELVLQNGVTLLAQLLRVATRTLDALSSQGDGAFHSRRSFLTTIEHLIRTLGCIAFFDSGRQSISALPTLSKLLVDWKLCIDGSLVDASGLKDNSVRLFALEGIVHVAKSETLWSGFIKCGLIWSLLRLLLAFDPTADGVERSDRGEIDSSVRSMNILANLAVLALQALLDTADSKNHGLLAKALEALLTRPVAKLLRMNRTGEILRVLNSNVEEPCLIWNVGMREELEAFLDAMERERPQRKLQDVEAELAAARSFEFTNMQQEFVAGGVYVRVFVASGKEAIGRIESVSAFAESLLIFLARSLNRILEQKIPLAELGNEPPFQIDVSHPNFLMAANAMRKLLRLAETNRELLVHSKCLVPTIFGMLEVSSHFQFEAFEAACEILSILSSRQVFADMVAESGELWRLMFVLERPANSGDSFFEGVERAQICQQKAQNVWGIMEALSSYPSIAKQLMQSTGWLELLGVLVGYASFTKAWTARLGAAKALSRILLDPTVGAAADRLFRRFLPNTFAVLLKEEPELLLKSFDNEADTPEVIWNQSMRGELRRVIAGLLDSLSHGGGRNYSEEFVLSPEVQVTYAELENELEIGGVYVFGFLKNPKYALRDPGQFLELLLQRWMQELADTNGDLLQNDGKVAATGSHGALHAITTAIVLLCKGSGSLCDRLSEWGYISRSVAALDRVLKREFSDARLVCIVRVLHVAADRVANVDALASVNVVSTTIRAIGDEVLHPDSACMVEMLLKTFRVALADSDKPATMGGQSTAPTVLGLIASSPASGEDPVRFTSDKIELAPSPAPGDGPVHGNRERVPLGDDPLAMFGGATVPDSGYHRDAANGQQQVHQHVTGAYEQQRYQQTTNRSSYGDFQQQYPLQGFQQHTYDSSVNMNPLQLVIGTHNDFLFHQGSSDQPGQMFFSPQHHLRSSRICHSNDYDAKASQQPVLGQQGVSDSSRSVAGRSDQHRICEEKSKFTAQYDSEKNKDDAVASLGAGSLNQPIATVLGVNAHQQMSSDSGNNFSDDDSTESSPPMTLFGESPLPQDPSGPALFGSNQLRTSPPQTVNHGVPDQGVLRHNIEQNQHLQQEGEWWHSNVDEAMCRLHAGSGSGDRPATEASGIDDQATPCHGITTEQRAASIGCAPGATRGCRALLQQALTCKLCDFLVNSFLENPGLEDIKDPTGGKVHAIALLKLLSCAPGYGMKFALILDETPAWNKYKSQDHALLLSPSDRSDYFLIEGDAGNQHLTQET